MSCITRKPASSVSDLIMVRHNKPVQSQKDEISDMEIEGFSHDTTRIRTELEYKCGHKS